MRTRTGVGPFCAAGLSMAAVCLCLVGAAAAGCIDYSNYLHWVGSADTPGLACGVATSGSYAYIADRQGGLQVVDITDPASPQIVGTLATPRMILDLAVSGTYAYAVGVGWGLTVIDIADPEHPSVVGDLSRPGQAQGIAVSGTYAYVAAAGDGLRVVGISDPANPNSVGMVDTPGSACGVAVSGGYAYVADWTSGLQIIDVTDPANPQIVGNWPTPAYSAAVAVSGTHAYVADYHDGLKVLDISNPTSPQLVGHVAVKDRAVSVVISGTYAYVADRYRGLEVIDISDAASPRLIGSVDTPLYAADVSVTMTYACIADRDGGLEVIDVTNPASPEIVGSRDTPGNGVSVALSGTSAFVADGNSGLQVMSIATRTNPQIIGSLDTPGSASGIAILGAYAYVADSDSGLQVVDITNPASPGIVGSVLMPSHAGDVAASGLRAFVADPNFGLQVVDITNPAHPTIVGSAQTPGSALSVVVSGSFAYVAGDTSGFHVVDVANAADPVIVGSVHTRYKALHAAISGSYAYVADSDSGLSVIDISNPTSPELVGRVETPGAASRVTVSDGYAYVADGASGVQVIDVADPAHPRLIGNLVPPGYPNALAVSGNYAYLADGLWGLQILSSQCPSGGGTVWRVPLDAPTIQAGIDSASAGDIVEVASGVYTGSGNRDIKFNGKAITVRSAAGDPADCTVNCEGSAETRHRGFVFEADEGPNSVLEGFTITGGYQIGGAGILVKSAGARIRNCIVTGNAGGDAAGLQVIDTSSVVVEDCQFIANDATNYGGGVGVSDHCTAVFRLCAFSQNTTEFAGGALSAHTSNVTLDSCLFVDNAAPNGGALALNHAGYDLEIRHCTFYGNQGTQGSSILAANSAAVVVANTIMASGELGAPVGCVVGSSVSLACCDLYDNAVGDYVGCVAGELGVGGNISAAPLFRNAEMGDLSLDASSPCTAENSPSGCGQIGALGVRCAQAGDDADGDGVPGTADLCPSVDASGFDSNGDGCIDDGHGARHVEYWSQDAFPLAYSCPAAGCPGITDDSEFSAIEAALTSWLSIDGVGATTTGLGTQASGDANALDQVNLITFTDPDYHFCAGTIAVGLTTSFTEATWYGGGCRRPGEIVDADIIFNPELTYRTDTQGPENGIDIQSVAAHELGHSFGISHSALASATMYFVLQDGTAARSLEWDDQVQMVKAYGTPAKMASASRLSGAIADGYDGEPVTGAAVFAVSEASGDTLGCEYTLQDGNYEFIGLPDGDYYVAAHPLDGSSAVNYMRPAYINDRLAGVPVTSFVPEAWDSLESATDDAGDRDPIAVLAGTTAVANIVTNVDAAAPWVVSTVPDSNAAGAPIDAAVLISFSERLNTETLQGNFSLTDTTTQDFISGNAAFLKDDSLIAFVPIAELDYASTYRLRIETGLEDKFGNHLAEDFIMLFTTEPEPDVVLKSISPSKGVAGMAVALNGKGFDPVAANDSVSFNGAEAEVLEASPTQLLVTVPQGAASGAVSVYNITQAKTSNGLQFTMLSPDEAPRGFESGVCALGGTPYAVTTTADGLYAFVATDLGAVAVVAAPESSDYMTAVTVPIPGGLTAIDAGPTGDRVYGVSSVTGKFYRIDATWGAVGLLSEKLLGATPRGILVNPNGRRAFIPTDAGEIQIWDIDEQSPSFETQIGVVPQVDTDVLGELAMGPAGQALLAPTGAGKLLIVDPDSNRVTASVNVGGHPRDVAVDPTTNRAYVCDETGVLTVVSLDPAAALWTTKLGGSLYGISLTPSGSFALVVNRELNLINAVDLRASSASFLSTVATINLPLNPVDIDLSPDGDYAFTVSEAEKKLVATEIGIGPSLTSLSRRAGPAGTNLVLAGSGFTEAGGAIVLFEGVGYVLATPEWVADSSVAVLVPESAISGLVSVSIGRTPSRESNGLYFKVLGATEDDILRAAAAVPGSPAPDGGSVFRASPAGDYLAVADRSGQLHALLLDATSPQYLKYVRSLGLGCNASCVAFSPDGERAFVVLPDSDAVLVIGADRLKANFFAVLDTIDFSGIPGSVVDVAVTSPDGSLLLVSDPGGVLVHCVDIVDGSTTEYQIAASVQVSTPNGNSRVSDVAFYPDGHCAYLGLEDYPRVCVLDTDPTSATYLELTGGWVDLSGGIPEQVPASLAFTPDGSRCLVLARSDSGDPTRAVVMLDSDDERHPSIGTWLDLGGTASAVREQIVVSPRGDRAVAGVRGVGLYNLEIQADPDSLSLLQQVGGASQHLTTVGLAYAGDASTFYCLSESADTLCVYDFSAAETMAIYSGDGQSGVVSAPLARPLRVRVTDGVDAPVAGVPVEFSVTSGGGRFESGDSTAQMAITNAVGIAEAVWTLGPDLGAGAQTAKASATGLAGSPLIFTATGVTDPMTLPLTVVSVIPDSGTSSVDIATATQTVFTRPVDVATITPSTFYMHDGDFQPLQAVFGFTDGNTRISLTPKVSLEPSTAYWIEATTGIKDASGGPLADAVTSSFTTGPAAATGLGSIAPASAAVGAYVVLSGKGFNKQPAMNKVLFGSVETCVAAGCTDYLTVAVPVGAQTGAVRVINTALADTSNALSFVVLPPDMAYANNVLGSVTTSSATRSVGITPDGAVAFAVSPDADKVSAIGLANLATIASVPIGANPVAVAIDQGGTFAYVANHLDGTVSVVDADAQSSTYCTVVDVLTVGLGPTDLAMSPDGDRLIVANSGSGTVSIIDADSTSETYRNVVTSIATGAGSRTVAITPDGGRLYVGTDSGYIVISATDFGVVTSIATGAGSRSVSITPDGAFLVILTTGGVIDIYDIQPGSVWENQVVTKVAVGTGVTTVAISPDGGYLYMIQEVGDTIIVGVITIFNQFGVIAEGQEMPRYGIEVTLVDTLAVGEDPADIAFDPTGSGKVIVTTAGDCKLTVLGDPYAGATPPEPAEDLRNFPNPFCQATTIRFAITQPGHVRLSVYDVTGRLVRTLVNSDLKPDVYGVTWNGTDGNEHRVAGGIYFCRIEAGDLVRTNKMLLLR